MSLLLEGDVDICKILRSKLLTILRKEQLASPASYHLVENLIRQKIKLLKRVLTQKELTRIYKVSKNKGSKVCSKNELRRRGLCFICKGPWEPNHSCPGDRKEEIRIGQEGIPSYHWGSSIVMSIDFHESTHGKFEQLSKDDE